VSLEPSTSLCWVNPQVDTGLRKITNFCLNKVRGGHSPCESPVSIRAPLSPVPGSGALRVGVVFDPGDGSGGSGCLAQVRRSGPSAERAVDARDQGIGRQDVWVRRVSLYPSSTGPAGLDRIRVTDA
jgi:hypothetical protein